MTSVNKKCAVPACRIAFVLVPKFNMNALTTSIEPMRVANYVSGNTLYRWEFLSVDGGAVTASNDMQQLTKALDKDDFRRDIVFVCGSWNSEHYDNPALFNWLRRQDHLGVTLGAMCIGTYILARAKLLSGYRATLQWSCIQGFAEQYPKVRVEQSIFVVDRNRITSAGATVGIDMMLYDIKQRFGSQLAVEVADQLAHYPIRPPGTPQRQVEASAQQSLPHLLSEAIGLMENNLEEPLTIPDIADVIHVSQRKLERLFKQHTNATAIAYYRALRLQFARVLLTQTRLTIREISVACGFSSFSHFAKSFVVQFGKRPRDYRQAWPEQDTVPTWQGMTTSLMKFSDNAKKLQSSIDY